MIGRIAGILLEKNPPQILIDVQGVGYEVHVPMSTFCNLPELNAKIALLTHFVVREDAQLLFGFLTASERDAFRLLIKISGVGAKTALALLSGMSVCALTEAVTRQDISLLTHVPGIGKKTAERLVLELKGKLGGDFVASAGAATYSDAKIDIQSALVSLGYSDKEAAAAIRRLPEDVTLNDGIRQALQWIRQ